MSIHISFFIAWFLIIFSIPALSLHRGRKKFTPKVQFPRGEFEHNSEGRN